MIDTLITTMPIEVAQVTHEYHLIRWSPPFAARFEGTAIGIDVRRLPGLSRPDVWMRPLPDGTLLLLPPNNDVEADFLGQISHELRTPLNVIVGLTELLSATELTDQQRVFVDRVEQNSVALLGLIQDLLDHVKLEAGQLQLNPKTHDLHALLTGAVEAHRQAAEAKGLQLQLDLGPELPRWARVDGARLKQVAQELTQNAIKFTHQGGVHVTVRPRTDDDEQRLEIRVRDTGPGIAPSVQSLIFTRFFRASKSSTNRSGTGLGLTVCKALVELLGGSLTLRSHPGEGSTFSATFAIELIAQGPQGRLRRPLHILVVDDNPDNLRVVCGMLQGQGHTVTRATDGMSALDALYTAAFDLVLMDVDMEPMDGIQATSEIRAREAMLGTPRIPIAALTAHDIADIREQCFEAGVQDFLVKPIDRETLAEAISRLVDNAARVLLLEGSGDTTLQVALENEGARVTSVATWSAARQAMGLQTFDVAVVDAELRDTDGDPWSDGPGLPSLVFAIGPPDSKPSPPGADRLVATFERPLRLADLVESLVDALRPKTQRIIDPDIADLVPAYLEDRRRDCDRLRKALEADDHEQVRRMAHRIRGTGTSYGYPDLTLVAGRLENAAREQDLARSATLIDEIASILDS